MTNKPKQVGSVLLYHLPNQYEIVYIGDVKRGRDSWNKIRFELIIPKKMEQIDLVRFIAANFNTSPKVRLTEKFVSLKGNKPNRIVLNVAQFISELEKRQRKPKSVEDLAKAAANLPEDELEYLILKLKALKD